MYSKRALSLAFILFIVGCGATRFDTKLPDSFSLKEGKP